MSESMSAEIIPLKEPLALTGLAAKAPAACLANENH
jgi:hypothetical protein